MATPPPGSSLYDLLGIKKDAAPEEVKSAYRQKVKKNHPDAGGDAAKFTAIAIAYRTLSDKDAREHYDKTGEERGPQRDVVQERAVNMIGAVFEKIVGHPDILMFNLPKEIEKNLKSIMEEARVAIAEADSQVLKMEKMRKKLAKRKKVEMQDYLTAMIDQRIVNMKAHRAKVEADRAAAKRALELIDLGYEYAPDVQTGGFATQSTNTFFVNPYAR